MSATQLSDIIEPTTFDAYTRQLTVERNAFFQSGVVVSDPSVQEKAGMSGSLFHLPYWNDLDNTEANVGSDSLVSSSSPVKVTAGEDQAVKHFRNQSWSSTDLAAAIAGDDPMRLIGDRVANYWSRQLQRYVIGSIQGLVADNIANDSGDMVYNIATDDVAAVAAAEKISAQSVITTLQTLGDHSFDVTAIAMHSVPFAELQAQGMIQFVRDATNTIDIPTYLGKRVIVDDQMPAVAGTNRITYETYLFGSGLFGYGEGMPKVPVEVEREPALGDGEGVEILHSRKHFIMHPRGVAFTNSSVAGKSPTITELKAAANWNRVYDRKRIKLAVLKTNG